ncbi:hypothetical protein [Halomonas sp. THAF12]|uniref:hypothetical protein n=1 Tax=Halomonas sp. THAF12 TaxID=2587849 RepID=UPI0012687F82|nr:hypothetical protein [Halomonas sp. THAF12]
MAKNKRNPKRQRALNARRQAASQPKGSFIANELHELIGADKESVVSAVRWRAKVNVYLILGFNLVAFLFLLYHTNANQGGVVSHNSPYIWACFFGFFILQMVFLHRYRRLIRNA